MPTNTDLEKLIINDLSESQYDSIEKKEKDQIYMTPDTNTYLNVVVSDVDPSSATGLPAGTVYIHTSSEEADDVMTKSIYDTDNDGVVDKAKTLSGLTATVNDLNSINELLPYNEAARCNLLHNSNFVNPINQRNAESYTYDSGRDSQYSIDRWLLSAGSVSIEENVGVNLTSAKLTQYLDRYGVLLGETLTLSVKLDGNVISVSGILSETVVSNETLSFYYNAIKGYLCVSITGSGVLSWAKLEVGSAYTPYVPKSSNEEYLDCYRYYVEFVPPSGGSMRATAATWAEGTYSMSYIVFPTAMRVKPTMTYSTLTFNSGQGAFNITDARLENSSEIVTNYVIVTATVAQAITSDYSGSLRIVSPGYLKFDAELY